MPPFYTFIGLAIILLSMATILLRIMPLASWFCPLVWYGYIVFIDGLVFNYAKKSLLHKLKRFFAICLLSIVFWLIFEIYNLFLKGWYYVNVPEPKVFAYAISFSTILPAVLETKEFLELSKHFDIRIKHIKIKKIFLKLLIIFGILFLIAPFIFPSTFMFFLVWIGFFLLFDSINSLLGQKSLIEDISNGKLNTPISVFISGYICGFLWEFWNYWALAKWHYTVSILESFKVFEIPFLGFFAYGFFAFELYSMYNFSLYLKNNLLKSF
ncbi:MAG: hypothetical protein QXE19_01070 [Candidatus Bathyarchaeia archaeon]